MNCVLPVRKMRFLGNSCSDGNENTGIRFNINFLFEANYLHNFSVHMEKITSQKRHENKGYLPPSLLAKDKNKISRRQSNIKIESRRILLPWVVTAENTETFDFQGMDEWPQLACVVERCVGGKDSRQFQSTVSEHAAVHLAPRLFHCLQQFGVLICVDYQIHYTSIWFPSAHICLGTSFAKYFVSL